MASLQFGSLVAIATLTFSCSSHPTVAEVVAPAPVPIKTAAKPVLSIETQQVAAEQKAEFVTELSFHQKQERLSAANKAMIQKLIVDAGKHGKVQEYRVITWADAEYPSLQAKKLPANERAIANRRNKAIQSYIEKQNSHVKVKTYSMAERANALKEFVGSSEARIKKSLESSGIPTTDNSVKYPPKASKSIIMAVMEY